MAAIAGAACSRDRAMYLDVQVQREAGCREWPCNTLLH
jgi:hypothetical protein